MAKIAIVRFTGLTPMIQSRYHAAPKLNKEKPDAYDLRTWRLKAHYSVDGTKLCDPDEEGARVAIPSDAFKQALDTIASRLGEKTKGSATYTKHFKSGVVCPKAYGLTQFDPSIFDEPLPIFCSSTGKKGVGSRVMRHFPQIPEDWQTEIEFSIWDDLITEEIFSRYCREAGFLIGVGAFRRENGGRGGTFSAEVISWGDMRFGGKA